MKQIKIRFPSTNFEVKAILNDTNIANKIYEFLPQESVVLTWGEEIYFELPLKLENEIPTVNVEIGDIAWWPDGSCFCIFFGKTPISKTSKPRPYSDVTIIGKINMTSEVLEKLKQIRPKSKVIVTQE